MLLLGEGEAELFTAQRRAGGGFSLCRMSQPCLAIAAGHCHLFHSPECHHKEGPPEGLRCCRVAPLSLCPPLGTTLGEAGVGCQPQAGTASLPTPVSGSRCL